jgi:hypothetical protein
MSCLMSIFGGSLNKNWTTVCRQSSIKQYKMSKYNAVPYCKLSAQ